MEKLKPKNSVETYFEDWLSNAALKSMFVESNCLVRSIEVAR